MAPAGSALQREQTIPGNLWTRPEPGRARRSLRGPQPASCLPPARSPLLSLAACLLQLEKSLPSSLAKGRKTNACPSGQRFKGQPQQGGHSHSSCRKAQRNLTLCTEARMSSTSTSISLPAQGQGRKDPDKEIHRIPPKLDPSFHCPEKGKPVKSTTRFRIRRPRLNLQGSDSVCTERGFSASARQNHCTGETQSTSQSRDVEKPRSSRIGTLHSKKVKQGQETMEKGSGFKVWHYHFLAVTA